MAITVDMLPWLIDISPFLTAISQTNWDTNTVSTAMVYAGRKASSGAQNDEINYDVVLALGTWTIELMHRTNTSNGIYTLQLDDSTVGTIDGYAAATDNVRSSVTGISVASTGKKRLKLLMATKNASSSNYTGIIQHIQLRRTA